MKIKLSLILVAAIFLAGCQLPKEEWVDFCQYNTLDDTRCFIPFSADSGNFGPDEFSACRTLGGGTVRDILDAEQQQTKTTGTNGAALMKNLISAFDNRKIRSYSGTYRSVDENGDSIVLSGRIVLPADGKVSRIMLVSHYTIGANYETPSNSVPLESIFAARGLAVFAPDYIGYGITSDRIHPYLCSDVTAKNVVDMYFAGRNFLDAVGLSPKYDDIFLLGYSQGGAVTMSVAHEIEWYHYADIAVRLVMCGGGPYDICATYDKLIDDDLTDYPCAIPMIIQGMKVGMHLDKLDYSKFFVKRMVDNMDNWLNSKTYTMAEITSIIGSKRVSSIMTPEARDKARSLMTDLYRAMVDNSVVNQWIPGYPLYLFHSMDDNVVPFENAISLTEKLVGNNVIYNWGHYGNHVKGCLTFYLTCLDLLKENGDL